MAGVDDVVRFRTRLLYQAEHALRGVVYQVGVPSPVADEAGRLLRGQILKRFREPSDWEAVEFPQSYLNQAARKALCKAFGRARKRLSGQVDPSEAERLMAVPPSLRQRQLSYEEIMSKLEEGRKVVTPLEHSVLDLARQGYKPRVIAATLGVTVGSMFEHLSTARKKIHEIFRRRGSA